MWQEIRAKRGRPLHLPGMVAGGMRSNEIGAEQTGFKSGEFTSLFAPKLKVDVRLRTIPLQLLDIPYIV